VAVLLIDVVVRAVEKATVDWTPDLGQEVLNRDAKAAELSSLHLCAGEPHHLSPFCDFDGY
jgi:hypothetical protein